MELGHRLTISGLTLLEASSVVSLVTHIYIYTHTHTHAHTHTHMLSHSHSHSFLILLSKGKRSINFVRQPHSYFRFSKHDLKTRSSLENFFGQKTLTLNQEMRFSPTSGVTAALMLVLNICNVLRISIWNLVSMSAHRHIT